MGTGMEATETTEQAVARTLAEADDLATAYPRVLQLMAERLDWAWASAWEPGPDGEAPLRCVASWWADTAFEPFEGITCSLALDPGEGLPGRVWESGEPAWVVDVAEDENFPRARVANSVGLHAALCFPARSGRAVVAVVELLHTDPREPDEELLRTLTALGDQMALAIERRRAEEAAHVGDQRNQAMLAAALDAVIAIDHRGRILNFNPAAERTFGYDAADVVGEDMADLIVPPSLRSRHRAGLARYLVTGAGPVLDRRVEITGMRADGSEFPVELTITRIDLPGPPTFTGYIRDITDRKQHEADLRASRARMVQAADEARRRLERDLHDGAQQRLVGLALDLRLARSRMDTSPDEAAALLDEAAEELAAATSELRELARGIHPAVLTEGGLDPALRTLVTRAGLPTRLTTPTEPRRVAAAVEVTAYFAVAEALTNVARYADATEIEVELIDDDERLVVEVRDDGRGGADPAHGTGLRGLADRVAALDGRLDVHSPAGEGTTIRVEIPCAS
jgi:PAS domain S-box-containing protein